MIETSLKRIPPFQALDIFRGLAAVFVVMGHACVAYLISHPEYASNPIYALSSKNALGVVMFFAVSGYCIVAAAYGSIASGKSTSRFILDRVRRIWPPYLAALTVTILLTATLLFASNHLGMGKINHPLPLHLTPAFLFSHIFLLQYPLGVPSILYVAWTLSYEIAFYGIVVVMLVAARVALQRFSPATAIWVLTFAMVSLTLATQIWMMANARAAPFPFDRWYQFGLGGLFFICWELCGPHGTASSPLRIFAWTSMIALLAASLTLPYFYSRPSTGLGSLSNGEEAAGAVGSVLLLCLFRPFDRAVSQLRFLRPLFFLGSFSYSIYLIHRPLLSLVGAPLRAFGFVGGLYWITYLAQIGFGVLSGWVFFLVVERHFTSAAQKRRVASELQAAGGVSLDATSRLFVVQPTE